jgi:hypothetical protein
MQILELKDLAGKRFDHPDLVEFFNRSPEKQKRMRASGRKPREITVKDIEFRIKTKRHFAKAEVAKEDNFVLTEDDISRLLAFGCGNSYYCTSKLPKRLRSYRGSRPDAGWRNRDSLHFGFELSDSFPDHQFSRDEFKAEFLAAMNQWNDADIGMDLIESSIGSNPEVIVRWVTSNSEEHDGLATNYIAHADFPVPLCEHVDELPIPVCFLSTQPYSIDGSNHYYDVHTVALHEIGHCIGLQHRGQDSIMSEIIRLGVHRELSPSIINAAKRLYS